MILLRARDAASDKLVKTFTSFFLLMYLEFESRVLIQINVANVILVFVEKARQNGSQEKQLDECAFKKNRFVIFTTKSHEYKQLILMIN
ncbi:hypothetical protein BpHYR1_039700 [Brachionus plicatilis]|uniref:Uncharacterized protein n=1 Tax=Brachionus plicatilis TaxID=10195 RepID=A0A3M7QCR7_BRAPC|nr:hypothetical protein BpHYR1_039700 [Brachionus plicatilis]